MSFKPRDYQVGAIDAGVVFFKENKHYHGIEILPTGSGKSVVIANIAGNVEGKTVVFQPSKEILEQNVKKFMSYGYRCGIYSASAGMKFLDSITFATIGSVASKHHIFSEFKNIIIDECHLVNAEQGMYRDFFDNMSHAKVLGLTATPYRLSSGIDGAMLKFLTRTRPKVFSKVLYFIQNHILFNQGHLCPLEYFAPQLIDRSRLTLNSTGSSFTDSSIKVESRRVNIPAKTIEYGNRLLKKRKNLLIFCSLNDEVRTVSAGIPGSVILTDETNKSAREKILADFKSGKIKCVVNNGILTTGFDYPELDTVLMAFSTMSLSKYYQVVGRVMRPHKSKETGWVIDLGGNINLFGKIETMLIEQNEKGLYYITNNGRQLTNVSFTRE